MKLAYGLVIGLSLVLFASSVSAQTAATAPAEKAAAKKTAKKDKKLTPEKIAKISEAIQPGLVVVEYTVRYDKGEEPYVAGWLPSAEFQDRFLGELVQQERPLLVPGMLISPTEVLTFDPMIQPRFLEAVKVRYQDEVISATPAQYAKEEQYAMILQLEKPFQNAKPLTFVANAKKPYFNVIDRMNNTRWTQMVKPFATEVMTVRGGKPCFLTPPGCLFVTKTGTPVAVNMNTHVFFHTKWKGSPQTLWPFLTAGQLDDMLKILQQRTDQGLLRVTLGFRSPKKEDERNEFGQRAVTELQVVGVLVEEKMLLVLASMPPKATARLERIEVNIPNGKSVTATFAGTLKDYGAFVATVDQPLPGKIVLSDGDIRQYEDRLLPAVELRIQGEKRVPYYQHRRIGGYALGWRSHVFPRLHGPEMNMFLFDEEGVLLALPIARRSTVLQDQQSEQNPQLTAAEYLQDVLTNLKDNLDASNIPLSEEEESRLAWLGVVLQPLNSDLARANKVSDLTRNGQSGALISYIYPDSPAAKAGMKPGDILLRLDVEGEPRPVEVKVERAGQSYYPMLWSRYDEIPEQLFDRIPRPWPAAENRFTRTLTDLGFGKKFTAEYVRAGKVLKADFTVTQSPPHYDTAEKYFCKPLGMTVRDLSYEVRQYFHRPVDQPGVIVSKIEPGSKASVAGLRPYEIITHVNDKPVMNVKDFETLLQQPGELRFEVKRWTRGRVVKVTLDLPASTQPASQPASQPAE